MLDIAVIILRQLPFQIYISLLHDYEQAMFKKVTIVISDSFLLLATKAALWKVSADGDSAYEKLDIPISGKVVAIDYDAASVRQLFPMLKLNLEHELLLFRGC